MEWLNRRFRMTDDDGVYQPHQPVYGIDASHPRLMAAFNQLCLTYSILLALAGAIDLPGTLVDIGCAEGYTAHTVAKLLSKEKSIRPVGFELSIEALRRAQSLYRLPGVVGNAHHLPFASESVDCVICSETVEHLVDAKQTLRELDRITKSVLLVTTPANWDPSAQDSFEKPDPERLFEHINQFTEGSLRHILGCHVEVLGARSVLRGFNRLQQTLIRRRWVNRMVLKILVWLNYAFARLLPHQTMHFVVLKSRGLHDKVGRRRIDLRILLQIRLLEALFECNALPKLKLT